MSFFRRTGGDLQDLSRDIQDPQDWKLGILRTIDYAVDVASLAFDPVCGLLALGTRTGLVQLIGRPGVEVTLRLPGQGIGVKSVQFSSPTSKLACLDEQNQLHLWDLTDYGVPKYLRVVKFDETNGITLSPSHNHAFLALASGEVRSYDIACLRKSPYTMPNMWKLYEQKMNDKWRFDQPSMLIETVIHPRDLNLLFVVFTGGIILSDLTQRNTTRVYELPFVRDLSRPLVTCFAIHPAAHFFACGYDNGTIGFWAVDDESAPLIIKDLEENDLVASRPDVEPIFKLSWCGFSNSSDPRGGETVLTILGGLTPGAPPGLTTHLLPPFQPSDVTPGGEQSTLHPSIRIAMQHSIIPINTYFYYTLGPIHDYLLISRLTPHFAGCFDPSEILLLYESPGGPRIVEGYLFPPPLFDAPLAPPAPLTAGTLTADPLDHLSSTLRDMDLSSDPKRITLPNTLSAPTISGKLLIFERDAYQNFGLHPAHESTFVRGGLALPDPSQENALKLVKHQPPRVLVTWHIDMTVQFQDMSGHLLVAEPPKHLENDFPVFFHNWTIDLNLVALDQSVSAKLNLTNSNISHVEFACEAFEVAIVLSTGEVIVYREAKNDDEAIPPQTLQDSQLMSLEHIQPLHGQKWAPFYMVIPRQNRRVSSCALSDIGFLATAYNDGTMSIVDMRGPREIYHSTEQAQSRHRLPFDHHSSVDPVDYMVWTIAPLSEDIRSQIRLLAIRASGHTQILTISRDSSSWSCHVLKETVDATPAPLACFVLSAKTGKEIAANRAAYSGLGRSQANVQSLSIFLSVNSKGARCYLDITGDRISKAEWGSSEGTGVHAFVVERMGSHALVVFTDRSEVLVYSLPLLSPLHRLKLPRGSSTHITADAQGDFVAWSHVPNSRIVDSAIYGTLFAFRRVSGQPQFDLLASRQNIPSQPQPVSVGPPSLLGSWFKIGGGSLTGEQVDTLLGGPERPVPQESARTRGESSAAGYSAYFTGASSFAANAAAGSAGLYDRLSSAVNERGQMLGDLEDKFNALEQGSKSMVTNAKKMAAQQTAKGWFGM